MLIRDVFLLKFAFLGFGNDQRAIEIIDEQIETYEAQLKQRQMNRKRWENQSLYVRLIVDLGITQMEMYLEWLRNARNEIENQLKRNSPKKSIVS
jgi:hypothetical protein